MEKCPTKWLMKMPVPTDNTPLPPSVVAAVDGHNLALLSECIGRQGVLIDVIDKANRDRISAFSLESK
jgi:hypothetical protein